MYIFLKISQAKKDALIEKYSGLLQKQDTAWTKMIQERDASDASFRASINQLQESLDRQSAINKDLEAQLAAAAAAAKEERAEYEKLQAVSTSAQEEVLAWQKEHAALSAELEAKTKGFEAALNERAQEAHSRAEAARAEADSRLLALTQELEAKQKTADDIYADLEASDARNEGLKQDLLSLDRKFQQDLGAVQRELSALNSKHEDLQARAKETEEHLAQKEEELAALLTKVAGLQEQVDADARAKIAAQEREAEAAEKIKQMQSDQAGLIQDLQEAKDVMTQTMEQQQALQRASKLEAETLQGTIKQHSAEMVRLQGELKTSKQTADSQAAEMAKTIEQLTEAREKETTAVVSLREQLESSRSEALKSKEEARGFSAEMHEKAKALAEQQKVMQRLEQSLRASDEQGRTHIKEKAEMQANIAAATEQAKRIKLGVNRVREIKVACFTTAELDALFSKHDKDKSGDIDPQEMKSLVEDLCGIMQKQLEECRSEASICSCPCTWMCACHTRTHAYTNR